MHLRPSEAKQDGGAGVPKYKNVREHLSPARKNPIIPATSGGRKPASELLYIFLSRCHFIVILQLI